MGFEMKISPADPTGKNQQIGFQISNLAITRRPDGLTSSRFQLSAYFCTLFLVRWVPGLKSFNLIDLINLGLLSRGSGGPSGVHPASIPRPSKVHQASIQGPSRVHTGSIRGPSGVHLGSIWGPSRVHLGSIRGPSGVRLGSIWGPSGVHPLP